MEPSDYYPSKAKMQSRFNCLVTVIITLCFPQRRKGIVLDCGHVIFTDVTLDELDEVAS